LLSSSAAAQPTGAPTELDIADAIQFGTFGDPAPYPLRGLARPGIVNRAIVGVVYTPFIRIALAAKVARLNGEPFTRDDVTARLAEPVVYVAFRWYCGAPRERRRSL
jgi:hypothetical protein